MSKPDFSHGSPIVAGDRRSWSRWQPQGTNQLNLPLSRGWGGRRAGAGRPALSSRGSVPHRRRPAHRAEHPVHVTLRSICRSLRTQFVFPTVRRAIALANRDGARVRIAEFSVQSDHVHLLVEADGRAALLQGLRGLSIRIARNVNRLLRRRGRFFADGFHARALTGPRAVRNALVYVLGNFRKHERCASAALDIYSSAPYRRDFLECPGELPAVRLRHALVPADDPPTAAARSWLLRAGWRRHGEISMFARPSS